MNTMFRATVKVGAKINAGHHKSDVSDDWS